jgi:hypothetical protein
MYARKRGEERKGGELLRILIPNTFSNEKMIYTILVDLDELIKVGIHDFSS